VMPVLGPTDRRSRETPETLEQWSFFTSPTAEFRTATTMGFTLRGLSDDGLESMGRTTISRSNGKCRACAGTGKNGSANAFGCRRGGLPRRAHDTSIIGGINARTSRWLPSQASSALHLATRLLWIDAGEENRDVELRDSRGHQADAGRG
jgi:hypothetical protein